MYSFMVTIHKEHRKTLASQKTDMEQLHNQLKVNQELGFEGRLNLLKYQTQILGLNVLMQNQLIKIRKDEIESEIDSEFTSNARIGYDARVLNRSQKEATVIQQAS